MRCGFSSQRIVICKGPMKLDMITGQAFVNGNLLDLNQKEFYVLCFLLKNEGKTLSKETIYETVWGTKMGDVAAAIHTCISRLKKKLADAGDDRIILSVSRNEGYTLEIIN
jgi:DNA-binding response OmpR family regulator